jgi:protein kinase A
MGNAASAKRETEHSGSGDHHQIQGFLKEARQKFEEQWNAPPSSTTHLEDYERIKTLGTGSYGRVMLVRHKLTGNMRAMKILEKKKIVRLKQVVSCWVKLSPRFID